MTLKELRKFKGITQKEAADYLGVPLRTYSDYENDTKKQTSIKYHYMLEKLESYGYIDEENGILTIDRIKNVCSDVFDKYAVEYCYLFGSYAKGKATETSDVDLLISTDVSGLRFYGMVEELREHLKKRAEVIEKKQLASNAELALEILKDGVKIYG